MQFFLYLYFVGLRENRDEIKSRQVHLLENLCHYQKLSLNRAHEIVWLCNIWFNKQFWARILCPNFLWSESYRPIANSWKNLWICFQFHFHFSKWHLLDSPCHLHELQQPFSTSSDFCCGHVWIQWRGNVQSDAVRETSCWPQWHRHSSVIVFSSFVHYQLDF